MSAKVSCVCGKQYAWKPELAGKRARCKCGQLVSFPAHAPVPKKQPVAAAVADDPFAALDNLAAMEQTDRVDDAPPPPPPPYRASRTDSPAVKSDSEGGPPMLTKLGVLAGGLAALGFFALWPMIQVMQGAQSISVGFKGIIAGAMLTVAGLNLVLLGDKGLPWKKTSDQPLTGLQKIIIAATVIAGLGITGLLWLFFKSHGYELAF